MYILYCFFVIAEKYIFFIYYLDVILAYFLISDGFRQ